MPIPSHISFARELRKNQTPQEKIIWKMVRNRRLNGCKFLRQHPILVSKYNHHKSFYIADFYCDEKRLVVEIDGFVHAFQIDDDKARDIIMSEMKLTVLRIKNEEVMADINAVRGKIKRYL